MHKYAKLLLSAVSGLTLLNGGSSFSKPADEEIVCKLPEYREYPLKLHSCATLPYGLTPFPVEEINPPEPVPPYTS